MPSLWATAFVALAAVIPASLGDKASPPPNDAVLRTLTNAPNCATPCLIAAVSNSTCAPADTACICTNKGVLDQGTSCILSSCSLVDALYTKNLTVEACGTPARDRSSEYDIMSITLGTIASTIVPVRLIFKRFFTASRELSPDDWVMFLTLVVGIPCTVINSVGMTAHGLGKDVWTVASSDITSFVRWFYVMEILYLTEMSLLKLSLSLFYLYIFPGATIHRILWATVILNVVIGLTFILTAIFQCTPIEYYWTQYVEQSAQGRCIDINAFGWGNAAISVAIDFWMLVIPFVQLRKLRLHWKKKIGIAIMFMTGAFVTIVSILRLKSLIYFAKSINPTWDQWNVAWWSTVEVNVGMICTCLPALRLILVRIFPRIFGSKSVSVVSAPARAKYPDPELELEGGSVDRIFTKHMPHNEYRRDSSITMD